MTHLGIGSRGLVSASSAPDLGEVWLGLQTFLTVPVFAAIIIGVATFAVPTVRWRRALKRDLDIFSGLPPGTERDLWQTRVEKQATDLREYLTLVPWWDRFLGWICVVLTVSAIAACARFGIPDGLTAADWIGYILGAVGGLFTSISTLLGRSFMGHLPQDYVAFHDYERARYARASTRRKARRRLARIRRRDGAALPAGED